MSDIKQTPLYKGVYNHFKTQMEARSNRRYHYVVKDPAYLNWLNGVYKRFFPKETIDVLYALASKEYMQDDAAVSLTIRNFTGTVSSLLYGELGCYADGTRYITVPEKTNGLTQALNTHGKTDLNRLACMVILDLYKDLDKIAV